MPSTSYRPERAFDAAIEQGKLSPAWIAATQMGHVTLDRALRLVLLMSAEESPAAERAARKFIVRFIREQEPSLLQVKKLADALHSAGHDGFLGFDAREALEDLAGRLAREQSSSWNPPE